MARALTADLARGDQGLARLSGLAGSLGGGPTLAALGAPPVFQPAPPDIPRELLGPTQGTFYGPDGRAATHLNMVTEHPLLPGRQTMVPMLVPGQIEIQRLLSGQPATRGQYDRAVGHAKQQALGGQLLPTFETIPEALQYEQDWRQDVIPQLEDRAPGLRRLMGFDG